jgi:hypothetical protein
VSRAHKSVSIGGALLGFNRDFSPFLDGFCYGFPDPRLNILIKEWIVQIMGSMRRWIVNDNFRRT